jgi:hypothetical protein
MYVRRYPLFAGRPGGEDEFVGPAGQSQYDVAPDRERRDNVPSVFRRSVEDSERRSSPAIGFLRVQACSHEH